MAHKPRDGEYREESRAIPSIEALLDEGKNRDHILQATARKTDATLHRLLLTDTERRTGHHREPVVSPIDEIIFGELFNPNAPTVVIDANHSFQGNELVALAAAERNLNIIIVPSLTDCCRITELIDGSYALAVSHGIIIDHEGQVFAGQLPVPIGADVFETASPTLLEQCELYGIRTFNDLELTNQSIAKSNVAELATAARINSPRRVALEDMWRDRPETQYVIKPSLSSGGRGVRMFNNASQRSEAETYFNMLASANYVPVIEERVINWPLFAPVSEETSDGNRRQLDWNVRAIISHGNLIDIYVRADIADRAVNISSGARAIKIEDLSTYTDAESAALLTNLILEAAVNLAEITPTGLAAADIAINEHLEPYIYELNVGHLGGMQTLAKMYDQPAAKLQGAHRLISSWLEDLSPNTYPLKATMNSIKLSRTLQDMHNGLKEIDSSILLFEISPQALTAQIKTHIEIVSIALAHFDNRFTNSESKNGDVEAYELLAHKAPLEFAAYALDFATSCTKPWVLLDYFNYLETILPHEARLWAQAKAMLYGQLGSPLLVREAMGAMVRAGEDPNSALKIASGTFVFPIYQQLDVTVTADNLDPYNLLPICADYFSSHYEEAMASIEQSYDQSNTSAEALLLLGLKLQVAEGDIDRIRLFLELNKDGADALMSVLSEFEDSISSNNREASIMINCNALINYISRVLVFFVHHGSEFTIDEQAQLAYELADSFAANYDEHEHAADFAEFLLAYLHNPESAKSLLPPKGTFYQLAKALFEPDWSEELWKEIQANDKLGEEDQRTLVDAITHGVSLPDMATAYKDK